MKPPKQRRGRPPKYGETLLQPITIRFPVPMMHRIEALIKIRADQPDRGQMVRELVARGLEAMENVKVRKS